ncbi:MAG: LysM peptidoglycan-binding domain-containing protein, partial [Caldilineae bacterium]
PYVVVPPPPPSPPTPEPARRVEGVALRGLLERRYDVDMYELIALDVRQPLTVEMIYDPPEQLRLDESFNFYIFNENQLRDMRAGFLHPVRAPNTAAGHKIQEGDQTVWRAVIAEPVYRYTVLVTQDWYARSVDYRLTVQNGLLTDPSGQAQVLAGPPQQRPFPGQIYMVQPGDTLSRIAQRVYGDKYLYLALCRYNNLTNCSLLQPGQRLMLPPRSALPDVGPSLPTPVPLTKREPTPTPTPGPPLEDNVVELVTRTPDLQILALILDPMESFTALLAGSGPFTVLAPTDAAFNELETAQFEALLDTENPPLALLQGHVIRGRLTTSRITGVKHFRTLNGSLVRFERQEDGSLTVNGA